MNSSELTGEYLEIYNDLIMPVDTDISIDSVILSGENTHKLKEFLDEYQYRDKFTKYKLRAMNRILMYGASGTGKTYLSKALSNKLDYTMLYIDIAKSLSEGDVSTNISKIFKLSNHMGKCVIMLDECDSIAWNRDSSSSDTGIIRRATNSIFQNLDQMNKDSVFIAATNMLHRLDPAFERRFDVKMKFNKPELDLVASIEKFLYKDFILVYDVDDTIKEIVERRINLSYYAIQGIVEKSMKKSVMANTSEVHLKDIYNDIAIASRITIQYNPYEFE